MATKFLEPGGDADFGILLWPGKEGIGTDPVVATDFVHGGHVKSIKYAINSASYLLASNLVADTGGRASIWIYLNALPTASAGLFQLETAGDTNSVAGVQITSAGVLQLQKNQTTQIGINGSTLSTGQWYRLCFAWTITSTTVNEFRLFLNGVLDITVTNATITNTSSADFQIGNFYPDTTLDFRSSDHYIDNSSALTDPGNIWVTAKRPNANGTTNNFNTQVGSGGSGYGTGHSPQVNERALSTTNGWSIVAVAATTEEYNIESASTGDINISTATLVDYMGWLYTKAVLAETAQIIVNNVTNNISIPANTNTMFRQIAGSTTYPAGTGTDIGEVTAATATTVSLYECGIVFAYIPAVPAVTRAMPYLNLLGVGT